MRTKGGGNEQPCRRMVKFNVTFLRKSDMSKRDGRVDDRVDGESGVLLLCFFRGRWLTA